MADTSKKPTEKKSEALEPGKKLDPALLEEDDEFEEFPVEEWQASKSGDGDEEEEEEEGNVWEDNWDDDTVEDDFSKQLRAELEKAGHKPKTVA